MYDFEYIKLAKFQISKLEISAVSTISKSFQTTLGYVPPSLF